MRVAHAREIMGRSNGVVQAAYVLRDIEPVVRKRVERFYKQGSKMPDTITASVMNESRRHNFDPPFLVAVIETESGFRNNARGLAGELGLMQLLPETAKWVAQNSKIPWRGAKALKEPAYNIRIGSAYLALLRNDFGPRSPLYLSAYNMGASNVRQLLQEGKRPREYYLRVRSRYISFYNVKN